MFYHYTYVTIELLALNTLAAVLLCCDCSFQNHNQIRRPMPKTDIHARSCFQKWKLKPNRTTGIVATLLGLLKPVMVTNKDVCLNLPVAIRQVIVLVVAIGSGTDA